MKLSRLDALADGIFAIVMTLLIIEIRVPEFHEPISDAQLWHSLQELAPLFLSYVLSFTLLFTYWRAHSYTIMQAKGINIPMANYNALFFFFIGLVPFTTHLLGRYSYSRLAVFLYGLNIILIGASLFAVRVYVQKNLLPDGVQIPERSRRHSNIRMMVPVVCSVIAILLSFVNTMGSMIVFTCMILINLTRMGADILDYLLGKVEKK